MPDNQIQYEVRYTLWFRIIVVLSILVMFFMVFISWMAYTIEGVSWGLPAAIIMFFSGLLALGALAASPLSVQFGRDKLVVRRWLGTATMDYRDILAVRQSYTFITLVSPDKTVRLYKLFANDDAKLMTALEKYVPVANAIQEKRLYPSLPFTIYHSKLGPILSFFFMLSMFVFGALSIYFTINEPETLDSWQFICIPLMSLMALGFGLLFLYMFLTNFARKIVFTSSEIQLYLPLTVKRYPVQGLTGVRVKEDPRTVRGVPRTVYQLELLYTDGSLVLLEPNGFSFPVDYIDAKEKQKTAELAIQLRHAYSLSSESPNKVDPQPKAKPAPVKKPTPKTEPSGESPMSGPLAPASPAHALIEEIRQMSDDDYYSEFETLRDKLADLGPEAMPIVLNAARQGNDLTMIDLLVTVLVDFSYPPAMPMMVTWLEHPNDEVRFAAAMALDFLSGGRFNIDGMIVGGWVQHDQIKAIVPQMQEWYHAEGQKKVPSVTEWLAKLKAMPTYTEQEKRYNFIEMNPKWVMLGNGQVFAPEANYRLPRQQGVHVIGGVVRLQGDGADRSAVFEMESEQGTVQKVVIKENGRWLDVGSHLLSMTPHFRF